MIHKAFRYWSHTSFLSSSRVYYHFSYQELKKDAQIATAIFKTILQLQKSEKNQFPNQSQKLIKYTLRQRIIDLIENEDKSKKSSIKNYFTIGELVDKEIAHNDRFIKFPYKFGKVPLKKKNLVFCPTYLTTRKLWKSLYYNDTTRLITGHFGIGKSYSCLLYKIISDFIYKYRQQQYLNFQKQLISKNVSLSQEQIRKKYKEDQQIKQEIPRVIYLSLKPDDTKQSIENRILSQCFELSSTQINNIKQKASKQGGILGGVQLNKIYQNKFKYSSFRFQLIFDQIGLLASCQRSQRRYKQLKDGIKDFQKLTPKKQNQIVRKQFKKDQKTLQEQLKLNQINALKNSLHKNFNSIYYLSSTDIERSILPILDLNLQHKHKPATEQRLDYRKNETRKQAMLDFVQLIGLNFEGNEQIMNNIQKYSKKTGQQTGQQTQKEINEQHYKSSQQFIKNLKKQFYDNLQQNYNFITPYFIQIAFQNYLQNLQNKQFEQSFYINKKQRKVIIKQIIDQIRQTCLQKYGDFLDKFLQKNQKKDILVIKALIMIKFQKEIYNRKIQIHKFQQILQKYKSKLTQNKSKQSTIPNNNSQAIKKLQTTIQYINKQIQKLKNVSIKLLNVPKDKQLLEDSISKDIFKLVYYQSKPIQVRSKIPFETLLELFIQKQSKIIDLIFQVADDILKDLGQGSSLGSIIETKFKNVLESGEGNVSWKITDQNKNNLVFSFIYKIGQDLQGQKKIQKPLIYGFAAIPQKRKPKQAKDQIQNKILNQNQNQKSDKKQDQNSQIQYEKLLEQLNQIQDKESITSFNFLQSFKQYFPKIKIDEPIQQYQRTHIFYPLKSNMLKNIKQIVKNGLTDNQKRQIHQTSKSIDFVVAVVGKRKITLNLYDIAKDQTKLNEKIKGFLQSYIKFGDKYQDKYSVQKGVQHKVKLNYIVFTPNRLQKNSKWRKNIQKFLEKESKEIQSVDHTTFVELERKAEDGSKSSLLLDKIIHLTFKDLKYKRVKDNLSKSTMIWRKVLQKWIYKQK